MKGRSYRKQILLFLLAVILPSLVLIVLTVRMIGQEKELAQKRSADERRRITREIGQHLLVRLENIKLQETSATADWETMPPQFDYVNPEVVIVGLVEGRRLILPWERNRHLEEAAGLLNGPGYIGEIRAGEQEELSRKNYSQAVAYYNDAFEMAEEPLQKTYARLLAARALVKAARPSEASDHYSLILEEPYAICDEYGIPLALYAADRLVDLDSEDLPDVLTRIQSGIEEIRALTPSAAYFLKDLLDKIHTVVSPSENPSAMKIIDDGSEAIDRHLLLQEQTMALQNDFLSLGLMSSQTNQQEKQAPLWVAYGENNWLASLAGSIPERPSFLIVVSAPAILTSLKADSAFREIFPAEFHFTSENDTEGLAPGPNFRGLQITYAEDASEVFGKQWSVQPAFYLLALALILGITLFGAYLLLRDVRREVSMAEMRSQFVSSVSHELKTPLTAIRMFAETMRLGRSKDAATQTEYLDTIVNESQRLTRLLNNVLDFSKIEQGKRIYHPEKTSLYEILESAARAMEYPLSQQGFKLRVQAVKGLPDVRVDRDALEQAILNLLNNAMKYSGMLKNIEMHLDRKDGHARIRVIDQGIGIAAEEQERIFEKFYRVSSPEIERIVGTGLGLTLVAHIVKAHNGYIEVDSEPGAGSTFSIYLPLEPEERE